MTVTLSHSFPVLGSVGIPLYAESEQTYKLVEKFTSSSIRHLQQQDHLGELRQVLECGLHSRYEYLFVRLYFVHFFKQYAHAFGMAAKILLPSGEEVSSCEELLKSWVFLEELGHLKGTYEAERFLLGALTTYDDCGDYFVSSFRDPRGQAFARNVLDSEDLWNLHRAIAWLVLEHHAKKLPDRTAEIDLAVDMLHALVVEEVSNPPLMRARSYFSRIRRLAHIYLDSATLPVFVGFHPSVLLQSFEQDPSPFLEKDEHVFDRLFGAMLDFLQNEVYSSVRANEYKLARYEGLLSTFASVRNKPAKSPAASRDKFASWMLAAKSSSFWGFKPAKIKRTHALRIQFNSDGYFEPDQLRVLSEERQFAHDVDSDRWSAFLTAYRGPLGNCLTIDLFENHSDSKTKEGKLIKALLSLIGRCYATLQSVGLVEWLCDEQHSELVRFILQRQFSENYQYRFPSEGQFLDRKSIILPTSNMRSNWSRTASWEQKRKKLSKQRNWEVDCLRREIRGAPTGTIIALSTPVVVEELANNSTVAEFDGVFCRVHGARVDLTLLEAKTLRRRPQKAAVDELKAKICKLGIPEQTANRLVVPTEKSARITLAIG